MASASMPSNSGITPIFSDVEAEIINGYFTELNSNNLLNNAKNIVLNIDNLQKLMQLLRTIFANKIVKKETENKKKIINLPISKSNENKTKDDIFSQLLKLLSTIDENIKSYNSNKTKDVLSQKVEELMTYIRNPLIFNQSKLNSINNKNYMFLDEIKLEEFKLEQTKKAEEQKQRNSIPIFSDEAINPINIFFNKIYQNQSWRYQIKYIYLSLENLIELITILNKLQSIKLQSPVFARKIMAVFSSNRQKQIEKENKNNKNNKQSKMELLTTIIENLTTFSKNTTNPVIDINLLLTTLKDNVLLNKKYFNQDTILRIIKDNFIVFASEDQISTMKTLYESKIQEETIKRNDIKQKAKEAAQEAKQEAAQKAAQNKNTNINILKRLAALKKGGMRKLTKNKTTKNKTTKNKTTKNKTTKNKTTKNKTTKNKKIKNKTTKNKK